MRNKFKQWLGSALDNNGRLLSQKRINKTMSHLDKLVLFLAKDIYMMPIPVLNKMMLDEFKEESKSLEMLVIFKRAVQPGSMNKNYMKWTIDRCLEVAKKYETLTAWAKRSAGSYNAARKNRWLEDVSGHMPKLRRKWSFEDCKTEANKHKSMNEWRKESSASYQAAYRAGWITRIRLIMKWN